MTDKNLVRIGCFLFLLVWFVATVQVAIYESN